MGQLFLGRSFSFCRFGDAKSKGGYQEYLIHKKLYPANNKIQKNTIAGLLCWRRNEFLEWSQIMLSYRVIIIKKMIKASIITLVLLFVMQNGIQFPISFAVVRNINQPLSLSRFFQSTGCCQTNPSTNVPASYNLVSLDGFSSTSTLTSISSSASPLSIWTNAYSAITASKDSIAGNSTTDVQNHILKKYHEASSLLIFNALSNEAPISVANMSTDILARNIINVLSATQLDGVSIEFCDYHAVAQGTASNWLNSLLSTLRQSIGNKIIVLIIPPVFALHIPLLQQPQVNSYVDFFVLKYYDTNKADYNSYDTLFSKSSNHPGTAFLELINNQQVWIDTCKTIIAKPVSSNRDRTSGGFIDSNTLSTAFAQMNSKTGWFGGFANLDLQGDIGLGFQLNVLQTIRKVCYTSSNCICK